MCQNTTGYAMRSYKCTGTGISMGGDIGNHKVGYPDKETLSRITNIAIRADLIKVLDQSKNRDH